MRKYIYVSKSIYLQVVHPSRPTDNTWQGRTSICHLSSVRGKWFMIIDFAESAKVTHSEIDYLTGVMSVWHGPQLSLLPSPNELNDSNPEIAGNFIYGGISRHHFIFSVTGMNVWWESCGWNFCFLVSSFVYYRQNVDTQL